MRADQNKLRSRIRRRRDSGIILIIVLWLIVILSMLAVGLSRRTGVELQLAKHSIGRMKSKYAAYAGIVYSVDKILTDTASPQSSRSDTAYQCGFDLEDGSLEGLFKEVPVGGGYFSIVQRAPGRDQYGFSDEDGKINLNALSTNNENYKILSHLIMLLGYDEDLAETVASSVIDWKDADDNVFNRPYGAESDDYLAREGGYPCKNRSFDSIYELLQVNGMTPEVFKSIKDYVTVFPKGGTFKINMDTASDIVLRAQARAMSGQKTNTGINDADSLADKLSDLRKGPDGLLGSEDDPVFKHEDIILNQNEQVLFLLMLSQRSTVSNYIRVPVSGVDEQSRISTDVLAVINRSSLAIVHWER